ncbi:MAG: nitroreductase family protein [Candidatus Nanoarchaeia archaeon]|jgi:nitroreductase|nr:nitroreductase family protein [Candidatus Nanoarchaeia archaeon]|tara:strand:- start:4003 stop:4674 length:672 start_codon:yes stop_codon:yes gene_type:complete
MDILEAIFARRSIRKFKKDTIPYRVLFDIFEAAVSAPRAGNVPSTWMVLVESDKLKTKLKDACVDQDWIEDAPVIIAVCSNPKRLTQLYGDRGEIYALQNSSAVIQNMLIAAQEYGLQGTWVGAFSESEVKKVLTHKNKMKNVNVHALVVLGKPDEHPKKLPEIQATDLVYYESWKEVNKASKMIPLANNPKLQNTIKRAKKRSKKTRHKLIKKIGKTIKHFK